MRFSMRPRNLSIHVAISFGWRVVSSNVVVSTYLSLRAVVGPAGEAPFGPGTTLQRLSYPAGLVLGGASWSP
ncbi:hypothetical protein ARMSODRAFT_165346 [Armillaria solidipes]|uniref:Uncharacterized protein n=1 Tax=Armillaria solidipes TaxID=1076256 RepID=A0A2H3BR78_9AGAR|nr:hypothetical protein ARMSODRAFT_165346 [Armillaria solidipes]